MPFVNSQTKAHQHPGQLNRAGYADKYYLSTSHSIGQVSLSHSLHALRAEQGRRTGGSTWSSGYVVICCKVCTYTYAKYFPILRSMIKYFENFWARGWEAEVKMRCKSRREAESKPPMVRASGALFLLTSAATKSPAFCRKPLRRRGGSAERRCGSATSPWRLRSHRLSAESRYAVAAARQSAAVVPPRHLGG